MTTFAERTLQHARSHLARRSTGVGRYDVDTSLALTILQSVEARATDTRRPRCGMHPTAADFALLRGDARRWWYHATLRAQGRHTEALPLENLSTRRRIADLRKAYLVGGARAGVWYHSGTYASHTSTSGCSWDTFALFARFAPGTPRIDKRGIADGRHFETLVYRAPMVAVDPPASDRFTFTGAFATVTPAVYCAIWETLGAAVHWGTVTPTAADRRDATAHLARMLRGLPGAVPTPAPVADSATQPSLF
jgi:hypothetical protein